MAKKKNAGDVTFLQQAAPIDEYGRALYAVARSIIRAMLDQLSQDDLQDINCDRPDVTLRQLAKLARLDRDKGLRGDGFEWSIHEAIAGGEPTVVEPVTSAFKRVSKNLRTDGAASLLFGYERAKYLGFLDAVIDDAGADAVLLPDGSGRPYRFGTWVSVAAQGPTAEARLTQRIKQIWKTDLFLSDTSGEKYVATTVKSNWKHLEDGRGLRLGIVPSATDLHPGVRKHGSLWLVSLPDPDGFMGIFNDAYNAVAQAINTLGKHDRGNYYSKPSVKGQVLQKQLEKYPTAKVVEIEDALNNAAQQNLINVKHRLIDVHAPPWLHMNAARTPVIAPKPVFRKIE